MFFKPKFNTFKSLFFYFFFISFLPFGAAAEQCRKPVNFGFGLFQENSIICSSKKFDGQRCSYSSAENQSYSYSTSYCSLDSNYEWTGRKIKYDFKVKDGWSKFKINLRSSSEGGECIIFEKMTGSNFLQGEFCDHQKQERFSEAEATHLIKSRLTFGNLTSVSTQNASVLSDDEIRQIFTPNNFYPNIKEDVAEAIAFAPGAEAVSEAELGLLSANKKGYIWKYLTKKRTPKAMVGAVPLSCNYRYYHSASKNLSSAISSAYKGCIDKISQYNQLLNKNCNCRLIALNNTLFYESSVYLGELGYTPILAQVEQNGQKILINGVAEWDKPGASFANFVLKNEKNIKICDGSFDIRNRAKGAIKINCFNGKFVGSGEFVTSGFDEELRVANGTAVINLGDGNEMRVVYGRDAM